VDLKKSLPWGHSRHEDFKQIRKGKNVKHGRSKERER